MGNALLDENKRDDPKEIYEQWLQQNPDLVGRKLLTFNNIFQANFFKYCEFSVKLLVFFRRDNTNIQDYLKAFTVIQNLVQKYKTVHLMPMRIIEMKEFKDKQLQIYTQKITVAIRQYINTTLEERLDSRPCLTEEEKIWVIYQMVFSVYTIHEIFNIYHGNIRTSNFLLNNYMYLYLTDFASYKPTYILQDTEQGLREFRLFYASSLEKCNIPPEKMIGKVNVNSQSLNSKALFNLNLDIGQEEKEKPATSVHQTYSSTTSGSKLKKIASETQMSSSTKKHQKKVYNGGDSESLQLMSRLKKMDMFSLGLAILEVLNDSRPLMTYSDLLKMNKEGIDFKPIIKESVSKLKKGSDALSYILLNLLKQKPQERISIEKTQQIVTSFIDHQMYYLMWLILSAFSRSSFSSCDLRIKLLYDLIDFIQNEVRSTNYKWTNQPPRCLADFKALKVFVEMLDKKSKMIFSPHLEGEDNIVSKLQSFFQNNEESIKKSNPAKDEGVQMCYINSDERRKFFIPTAKHSKIAKRLSIGIEILNRVKQLCPPSLKEIEKLLEKHTQHRKLTLSGLKQPRMQELLISYKQKQLVREQLLRRKKYYSTCEIMVKVVFSCIRGCKYVASKLIALQLMSLLGKDCSDQFKLHVLMPYFMHITEDNDITVCREAFFAFVNLFYCFLDPFNSQEDIRYYQLILQFLANIIRQSKNSKLRPTLFSNFREIFSILQWLQVHYRRFSSTIKIPSTRLLEVIDKNYGYLTKQEIRLLLNGNIPEQHLPFMFQFYLEIMNKDKLQALKLSSTVAKNVSPLSHRDILDAFDLSVDKGLDQIGIGLVYSIQYFTIRKNTSIAVIKKIAPHVINPNKWVRDEALNYITMCLNQFPPTKNYFFFKDCFLPPFPLKPEDMEEEVLLPIPLKDSEVSWNEKKLKINDYSPTIELFLDYLARSKETRAERRKNQEEIQKWNQTLRGVQDTAQEGKILQFETYIRRQLQLLFQYNFLLYIHNFSHRFVPDKQKDKPQDKTYLLACAFKDKSQSIDLSSIDYQKKQLFQMYQGRINSSFQRVYHKFNQSKGFLESVSDRIKLADAITIIGEVLCKFQMFKIRPIPKLRTYIKPNIYQRFTKPKGILLTEIYEHTDTVTCLEKVADQFILSGSADGTIRVFDARKIQANVTLNSEGWTEIKEGDEKAKIASVASFDLTYAAVVGSNRGQIRVCPIERFQRSQNAGKSDEIVKYAVSGELQKIVTLTNELKNECFCYITAEGNLGIQDIRLKSRAMGCSIGRERGLPRSLCATNHQSILVGTIDGYLINFDVRFNIISGVLQLQNQKETLPITNIVSVPSLDEQLFALTYPSKYFEFCYFNLQENRHQFGPERQYTSCEQSEIVSTPFLANRTNEEQFKLCRNGLMWRKTYEELRDFSKNFNIFDYLSDPLTIKQAKIREVWLDNSKNRYNQISSLYNKRHLPFLEFTKEGILTACNPLPTATQDIKQRPPFVLITEKKDPYRDVADNERPLTSRANTSHKVFGFGGEETREYFTCCEVVQNFVVAGCRNSELKIYS